MRGEIYQAGKRWNELFDHWRRHELARQGTCPMQAPCSCPLENEIGAELHHAAVLHQGGLQPQRTVREILDLNRAAVQEVEEIQIARQADALRQLKPFAQPQIQPRIPILEHRLRRQRRRKTGPAPFPPAGRDTIPPPGGTSSS